MICTKNAAPRVQYRERGRYGVTNQHTRQAPDRKPIDAEIGDNLLARSVEAERTFLAALWLNPEEGHDAAYLVGLTGEHFTSEEHSFLFCYACRCVAELGRWPMVAEAVDLANRTGAADLEQADVFDLFRNTNTNDGAELLYAETVVDLFAKRQRARRLLAELAELGGLPDAVPVNGTPKPAATLFIPDRLKGRYRRGR